LDDAAAGDNLVLTKKLNGEFSCLKSGW